MKLSNLIAAGIAATFMSTTFAYAQTAPTPPAEVMVMVKNEAMAEMEEVRAIVEALKAEGFTYIEIGRTLLGRAKIMAYGETSMREVVLSASTGEVLRDVMREHDGSMASGMDAAMGEGMTGEMDGSMSGGSDGGMGGGSGGGMGGGSGGDMGGGSGGGMGGS